MPANRDAATLLDIAQAARLILEFKGDLSNEAFMADPKTQSAILHQLLVIGEAAKRLSPEFRAEHTDTPWALMAGMRDNLIHAYDSVELEEVWRTIEADVPALLAKIRPMLGENPP